MDLKPILNAIQRTSKPAAKRLLLAGAWPESSQFHVEGGAGDSAPEDGHIAEIEHNNRLDEATGGPYDVVLWRPLAAWNDRLLEAASQLLTPRGRLWMQTTPILRRRLLRDLGRHGFAVLQDLQLDGRALFEIRHDGFVVRDYRPGDEEAILQLFKPCFHVERSPEHFRWKYLQNPWGQGLITLAESQEGELAAHYAGYPVPFYLAPTGETLLALQIGDTMTDPRFRRAGRGVTSLLGRCFRHFFASHCDEKIAFNYGFNTGNIRRFNFQFIKGRLARSVDFWRRGPEPPSPSGAGYRIEAIDEPGRDFDRFFYRVARHYGLLVRRDSAWLRWRFLECPDPPTFRLLAAYKGRRLVGWSVFRRRAQAEGDQLLWVDALFDPRDVAAASDLLRAALKQESDVADNQVREIVGWMAPNPPWWRRQIEQLGFTENPEPNDLALIHLPFTRPEIDQLLPEAYYTLGDGDLA